MCSLKENGDACLASIDNHDALHGISKIDASPIICTTCIDLKSEVEALKRICDDMSAKLFEHNDMSAKSFESRNSCHSDAGASKIASFQSELASSVEHESLDVSTSACVTNSSSIAIPKLASSGVAQDDPGDKSASQFFGTHTPKPKYHCTFCKKDGHTIEFCFRRVKHERRVRAKVFRKSRSLSYGTCDSKLGTKLRVDASGSKSQGTSHFKENDDFSSRTVPANRPLYHYSFCEKDGHEKSFCYRRARHMRQARASKSFGVHRLSHAMKTSEPSTRSRFMASLTPFRVGFVLIVDMLLALLVLVHDMRFMMLVLVLLLDPRETIASLLVVALVLVLELLFRGVLPRVAQILIIRTYICIMLTHMIN